VRRWLIIVPAAAAAAALAAGCGGSSTATPAGNASHPASHPASHAASPSASSPGGTAVSLHSVSGIPGQVLVGPNGRTLYLFEADKNGKSACSGACAQAWPPETVTGTPKAQAGAKQSMLGTTKRSDGTTQVTYDGHPLYYYAGDTAAGSAHGEGLKQFGAEWYVVSASGKKVDTS
jgi:predicted lipoprotein with Yx(FWY)xxD motif